MTKIEIVNKYDLMGLRLPDPRVDTFYSANYKGTSFIQSYSPENWFYQQNKFYVPNIVLEDECCSYPTITNRSAVNALSTNRPVYNRVIPGYQAKRVDKGYTLTINDYSLQPNLYLGDSWYKTE